MSAREVERAGVLRRVKEGKLKLVSAAQLMGISTRQAKRLWKRYQEQGIAGLKHGAAGRRSNRAKAERFRKRVLSLVRDKYSGGIEERFGPTLAAEHLASEDGLAISSGTLRRWMLSAGLWSRERKRGRYRKRRERKAHFGELVQLDGSFHDWLEKRGPQGCLMNLVDDATSTSLCHLGKQETTWAAANVLRLWIEHYGVPQALYTDWKNVYVRPASEAEKQAGKAPLTQFGRMCAKLGIGIIPARSPQAKGRVERNHGTHQDRLIKKLRRKSICSYEAANQFLSETYLPEHNRRYCRLAASEENFHRPRPSRRRLEEIFCLEQERRLSNDWVVRYDRRFLQMERESRHHAPAQAKVLVQEWQDGKLEIRYRGQKMAWKEILALPERPLVEKVTERLRPLPPSANHPWRRDYRNMRAQWDTGQW
ncbi:MAG TPA: ISNCY family transposase [Terriglobales bacterium]|nr:ISNCY family transposase [Terriglobales bacterium]